MFYALSFVAGGVVTFYGLILAKRIKDKASKLADTIKNLSAQ